MNLTCEYQLGINVFNNVPALFSLSENEQMEYNQMSGIYLMLSNLNQNGGTIESLTANQVNDLQTLACDGIQCPQAYARNILLAL